MFHFLFLFLMEDSYWWDFVIYRDYMLSFLRNGQIVLERSIPFMSLPATHVCVILYHLVTSVTVLVILMVVKRHIWHIWPALHFSDDS